MAEQERRDECENNHEAPPQRNIARKPIGAFDEPTQGNESLGILPPPISVEFEIKSSMLNLIERFTFKGDIEECPLRHLDRFDRSCRALRMNGVSENEMKMILFPFSLDEKGALWERSIPSSRVPTWEMVKKEFLIKFFPRQKTLKFRNEINGFKQGNEESFSNAWERLKGLTRDCPHHGTSKEQLLGIFYRGVLRECRRALDTASYGSFANLDCEQAEELIENLAKSDSSFEETQSKDLEGTRSIEDLKMEAIESKLEEIAKALLPSKKQVASMDSLEGNFQEDEDEGGDQVNYLEGSNKNYPKPTPYQQQGPYRKGHGGTRGIDEFKLMILSTFEDLSKESTKIKTDLEWMEANLAKRTDGLSSRATTLESSLKDIMQDEERSKYKRKGKGKIGEDECKRSH